jgi:hypothetical protein
MEKTIVSWSVINSAKLLNANREFISAEVIAFINNTYNTGFLYDKTKCSRDTGLIVDSVAFDLLYNGTTESTFAGLQYWNQDTYTGTIQTEITTTTNAIRYLKEVVEKVMSREAVTVTEGNTSTQLLSLPVASNEAIASVYNGTNCPRCSVTMRDASLSNKRIVSYCSSCFIAMPRNS